MSCTAIGEVHLVEQALQRLLRNGESRAEVRRLRCTSGKSSAGSVCSVKRLLPPCSVSLFCVDVQRDGLVGRQGAQDVDQLARADRGAEVAGVAAQRRRWCAPGSPGRWW